MSLNDINKLNLYELIDLHGEIAIDIRDRLSTVDPRHLLTEYEWRLPPNDIGIGLPVDIVFLKSITIDPAYHHSIKLISIDDCSSRLCYVYELDDHKKIDMYVRYDTTKNIIAAELRYFGTNFPLIKLESSGKRKVINHHTPERTENA